MIENREKVLTLRVRPSEELKLRSAAAAAGERLSCWIRQAAILQARRELVETDGDR